VAGRVAGRVPQQGRRRVAPVEWNQIIIKKRSGELSADQQAQWEDRLQHGMRLVETKAGPDAVQAVKDAMGLAAKAAEDELTTP
jgi:hypothetical protein